MKLCRIIAKGLLLGALGLVNPVAAGEQEDIVAGGQADITAGEQEDIAAVRHAAEQWITLYTAGDLDGLMSLYAPDAIVALHGKPALRGVQQIRDFFAPSLGRSRVNFEIDIEEIQIHGDAAHLLSRYYLTADPLSGGETYKDAGRSLLIYKRDANNEWKLYLDIDQATPDAAF